ncbi:MAG: bifunctional DNA-formamidopyrimidine glycosylase/DNA-(apurinic or apyrimidinic site) lyase [Gemmatimonadales bacterium]
MPELPEVETMVRDLVPLLARRRIEQAALSHDDVLQGVSRRALVAGLRGARILGLERRAKNAVIVTDRRRLVIQPGMTGAMMVKRAPAPEDRRYGVLQIRLDNGRTFVYHDVRRLGTIRWLDDAGWTTFSNAIGPEPLDPAFTPAVLGRVLAGSRTPIKKALMDQRRLAGVGNIYANEALFRAGLDPSKEARRLGPDDHERLHGHLVAILGAAVQASGTTFRDYRTGRGEPGNFQLQLDVYDREGQPCHRCGTTLTGTHQIDARITVFCHRCQR